MCAWLCVACVRRMVFVFSGGTPSRSGRQTAGGGSSSRSTSACTPRGRGATGVHGVSAPSDATPSRPEEAKAGRRVGSRVGTRCGGPTSELGEGSHTGIDDGEQADVDYSEQRSVLGGSQRPPWLESDPSDDNTKSSSLPSARRTAVARASQGTPRTAAATRAASPVTRPLPSRKGSHLDGTGASGSSSADDRLGADFATSLSKSETAGGAAPPTAFPGLEDPHLHAALFSAETAATGASPAAGAQATLLSPRHRPAGGNTDGSQLFNDTRSSAAANASQPDANTLDTYTDARNPTHQQQLLAAPRPQPATAARRLFSEFVRFDFEGLLSLARRRLQEALNQTQSPVHRVQTDTKEELRFADGTRKLIYPTGLQKLYTPIGWNFVLFANSDFKATAPDHLQLYHFFENKILQVFLPDGIQLNRFANGQVERQFKDGHTQIQFADGTRKEVLPSGEETIQFANGDEPSAVSTA
eukprot:GHVT01002624.1.p1 GENE.GHVT01002624.1~~GHVT01002624.1.p1  ORF type:complete len:472 (-),score=97.45 GHVT01002624.1:398-1813(-)